MGMILKMFVKINKKKKKILYKICISNYTSQICKQQTSDHNMVRDIYLARWFFWYISLMKK